MSTRLETERLILRAPIEKDLPHIVEHLGQWDIASMMGMVPRPYTAAHAESWYEVQRKRISKGEPSILTITERESGNDQLIGAIWTVRNENGTGRLGYWLGIRWWGKGYITEAGRACLDHAFATWKPNIVEAGIFEDNPASGRVLEKLGFQYIDTAQEWCEARQCEVLHLNFQLEAPK